MYRNPNCHSGYPRGIAADLNLEEPWFALRFQITAAYTFKDPNLAHEKIPELFVERLNRESGYDKYRVADGPDSHANIFVHIDQDATHDHYGMSVRMSGPDRFIVGTGGSVPSVNWFSFYLSPNYRTGFRLIEDAAVKTSQFLNNGWTC